MKYCKYCGAQIPEEAGICPVCKKDIKPKTLPETSEPRKQENTEPAGNRTFSREALKKKPVLAAIIVLGVILVVFMGNAFLNFGKCRSAGCKNKAVSGSDYCYTHKCAVPDCEREKFSFSNYCYTHYLTYDDDASDLLGFGGVTASDLKISDISLSSNSVSTIAEGRLTNNSDRTVSYVKIKGSFKDSLGNVVDTGWTYAVDSAGLEPGESCKWEIWVDKDYTIKKCDVSILDFND